MSSSLLGSQFTSLNPGTVSLSLFKLSFCTTANLRSNLLWTHLPNRDDLFAVFDSVFRKDLQGSVTEKKVLKLIRGGDLLENIELENLVLQARLDEERSKSQHLQDVDRHIIVMVKKPLLAIRYQLPTGQIRRLQMNFRPESGFDLAYRALHVLGLPIRERSQPPIQSLTINPIQPVQSLLPLMQQPPSAGLLPNPEFSFRPTTSNGYEYRPSSSAPERVSERPSTAPMSFTQMLPPRRELPFVVAPKPPTLELGLGSFDTSQQISQNGNAANVQTKMKKARAKPAKKEVLDPQIIGAGPATTKEKQTVEPQTKKRKNRTQPAKKDTLPLVEQKVPDTSTKDVEFSSVTAQPLQSSKGTIPDCVIDKHSSSPANQGEGQQNMPDDDAVIKNRNRTPLVLHPGAKALATLTESQKNGRQSPSTAIPARVNNATQTSLSMPDFSPEEYMGRLDEWVRKYQHLPAPMPRPPPVSDLASYATHSEDDRLAVLDNMICECLDDENFAKLVEDVDKSWKRIGLGF